jgi:hypothetical protein
MGVLLDLDDGPQFIDMAGPATYALFSVCVTVWTNGYHLLGLSDDPVAVDLSMDAGSAQVADMRGRR